MIDMEKAFKFRIYPNKTQQVLLQKTFGCTRYIYNHFLAKRIELYKQDKSSMSYNQCSKELTTLKQELTWLKEPDKDALQKSLKDLDVAYKNFFARPEVGFPRFKSKHDRHKSYRTSCTNGNIKFLGKKIQLPKLGKVKIKDKRTQLEGRILNATVSREPDGKYYVSICCTDVPMVALETVNHNVGIDLGLKEFAIASDGTKYANPKYLAKSLKLRMLSYKAEWYGRKIVKIDKFFPSSQICNCCGHKHAETKDLSVRKWACPQCGAVHDRDVNAAINVLSEGLRIVGV